MLILARESCAWCLVGQYIENLGGQNIASSRFWDSFSVTTQVRPPQHSVCLSVCLFVYLFHYKRFNVGRRPDSIGWLQNLGNSPFLNCFHHVYLVGA
jgi:hypothetical protein